MSKSFKKLVVVVLAIYILITTNRKKADLALLLKQISYIYYAIQFNENQAKIQALLDFDSKVNTIIVIYVAKLDFKIQPTNIGIQKIDNSTFKTLEIVIASF